MRHSNWRHTHILRTWAQASTYGSPNGRRTTPLWRVTRTHAKTGGNRVSARSLMARMCATEGIREVSARSSRATPLRPIVTCGAARKEFHAARRAREVNRGIIGSAIRRSVRREERLLSPNMSA